MKQMYELENLAIVKNMSIVYEQPVFTKYAQISEKYVQKYKTRFLETH